MRLNPTAIAIASALAIAIIWTLCSVLVVLLPSAMTEMTAHMMHARLEGFSWMLTLSGFLIGLIAWSVWAAATGWLISVIYNRISSATVAV